MVRADWPELRRWWRCMYVFWLEMSVVQPLARQAVESKIQYESWHQVETVDIFTMKRNKNLPSL